MQSRSFITAVVIPVILLVAIIAWALNPQSKVVKVPEKTTPQVCVKPELLVFYATWCSACKQIEEQVKQIEASGIKVVRINVDLERDIAKNYGVESLPTMVVIMNGRTRRTQDIAEALKWIREG